MRGRPGLGQRLRSLALHVSLLLLTWHLAHSEQPIMAGMASHMPWIAAALSP